MGAWRHVAAVGLLAPTLALVVGDAAEAAPSRIVVFDAKLHDIALQSRSDKAYATVREDSPVEPGMLVTFDVRTGEIIAANDVGEQPNVLDFPVASVMYVGLDGTGEVKQLSPPEFDGRYAPIDLGEDAGEQRVAVHIATSDAVDTFVVAASVPGRDDPHAGVLLADHDGVIDVIEPIGPGPDRIVFVDQNLHWFGFDSTAPEAGLVETRLEFDGFVESYVSELHAGVLFGGETAMLGGRGLLYTSEAIIETQPTPRVVAEFPLEVGRSRMGVISGGDGGIYVVEQEPASEGARLVLVRYGWTDPLHLPEPDDYPVNEVGRWEIGDSISSPKSIHGLAYGYVAVIDDDGTTVIVDTNPIPPPPFPDNPGSFGEFTAIDPTRFLDTRDGTGRGGVVGRLGPDSSIEVQIAGRLGVPPEDIDAVVLNVTAVEPTERSFLTVYPARIRRPTVASLNMVPGVNRANLATVQLGENGRLAVYNRFGSVDVVFDVAGYYSGVEGPAGARYRPVVPQRIMDTRDGTGRVPIGRLGEFDSRVLQVAGVGVVPASGVRAIVVNITAVGPSSRSFVVGHPAGEPRPLAANLNARPGFNVGNQATIKLSAGGAIELFNRAGSVDLVVDLVGYYEDAAASDSGPDGRVVAFAPSRGLDTRTVNWFDGDGRLRDGDAIYWSWPDSPPAALIANITATGASGSGNVRAYPYPGPRPLASTLNYGDAQTVPNHAIIPTGPHILIENLRGSTYLVIDVFGVVL